MSSVHPRLLHLAELLDETATEWEASLILLAEAIHPSATEVVLRQRKIAEQLHVAAERIREGKYTDG